MTSATNCSTVAKRAFDRIDTSIYSIGNMTGSNMLDVSSIGMTLAILKGNATIMTDALKHFYGEIAVTSNISADGIKPDGSFLQHGAQLYTGNYGKDFINSVLRIFIQTAGTSMTPSAPVQAAFKTLMEGTEWMILSNSTNHALLWQYSTIGRMVSFRTTDKQASGGVAINLTQITDATSTWKDKQVYQDIVQRLEKPADSANQGPLVGTRHFYRSDYMVHRGTNYIITLKMFSTRTSNSECNNNQNPFGFHLSDGSIFTYRYGDEYTDVFGAWDWNLVPGATVDYGATPLNCNHTQFFGNESFVGGVALNNTGIAVMNYTNPYTGSLSWQKTVIFFPNAYGVQISSARSKNDSAPIITTLDQRRQNTNVTIDGQEGIHEQYDKSLSDGKQHTLWSGDIGYTFPPVASTSEITLKTTMMNLKSNWSAIGISTGDERVPMYTATVQHGQKFEYYVQPALDKEAFVKKTNDSITFVRCEDPVVRGAYSPRDSALGLAFWTPGKFRRSFLTHDASKEEFEIAVETDHPIVLMFQQTSVWWDLAVADPSQLLKTVRLTITFEEKKPIKLDIKLPQGPLAGSSVIRKLKPCS
ncbi:hypothetical protein DFQ30_003145 [Apophysomyces sp. BC1015]|nr:hypothetical protein DFQ30_003145 [Apophysomyces sp. BC1015]